MHVTDQLTHGKGERGINTGDTVWRNCYDSTHNTFSRISSGVLAALQSLRGCYSIHKERAGCKVGSQRGAFAVCDCMGGSIYCKNYWTAANVKKLTTKNIKGDM